MEKTVAHWAVEVDRTFRLNISNPEFERLCDILLPAPERIAREMMSSTADAVLRLIRPTNKAA